MRVSELNEELKNYISNTDVRIEIGNECREIKALYINKGGSLIVTDSLSPDGIPFKNRERIKAEIMDLANDLDYLEGECSRASRKIEKILDLLERSK